MLKHVGAAHIRRSPALVVLVAGHIYLHLDGIKFHGPSILWPCQYLDHGLQLTQGEALRLAEALIANVRLARGEQI